MDAKLFDESFRARLAVGWPEVRVLREDHPDDAPKAYARKVKNAICVIDPHYHVEWPTRIARGFVRAMGQVRRAGDYYRAATKIEGVPDGDTDVSAKEARAILKRMLTLPTMNYEFHVRDSVYLLEQLVGGEVVADALLTAYETYDAKRWRADNPHDENHAAYALGYVLRRLPTKARAAATKRIEALLRAHPSDGESNIDHLALTIGGLPAVKSHSYAASWPLRLDICEFVEDSPEHVVMASLSRPHPHTIGARFVYLGGEEVLASFVPQVPKLAACRRASFFDEMAIFRSPHVVGIALQIGQTKKLRPAVEAWVAEHARFVRPLLEKATDVDAAMELIRCVPEGTSAAKAKKLRKQGETAAALAKELLG